MAKNPRCQTCFLILQIPIQLSIYRMPPEPTPIHVGGPHGLFLAQTASSGSSVGFRSGESGGQVDRYNRTTVLETHKESVKQCSKPQRQTVQHCSKAKRKAYNRTTVLETHKESVKQCSKAKRQTAEPCRKPKRKAYNSIQVHRPKRKAYHNAINQKEGLRQDNSAANPQGKCTTGQQC